ncbi:MAG: hypothetical protein K1X92_18935 [Bacteroidia bacterium]|nr:hypothetical protein [Bacteroidia bacterium]
MKKIASVFFFLFSVVSAFSQCPMCKMVAQSAQRESGKGLTLNDGIAYLFVIPYLAIFVVGFLWYRRSKKLQKETAGE